MPSLWTTLPRSWRSEDPRGSTAALVGVLDGELEALYTELSGFRRVWQVLSTPERFLPYLAHELGWQLDTASPEALRRKVVGLLVGLYRAKGTQPGIRAVLRAFLGVEARTRALWADAWRLGRSHLGARVFRLSATGGELLVVLPWRYTPGHGALEVSTSVPVAFTESSSTSITLASPLAPGDKLTVRSTEDDVTRLGASVAWRYVAQKGDTALLLPFRYRPSHMHAFVATGGERVISLPWSYSPGVTRLELRLDGALQQQGSAYFESSPRSLTLAEPLTAGVRFQLFAGTFDLRVLVDGLVLDPTASVPEYLEGSELESSASLGFLAPLVAGKVLEVTHARAALTLLVELPRVLTAEERALTLELLEVWKPSKAFVILREPSSPAPLWRLGRSHLGSDTALGRARSPG